MNEDKEIEKPFCRICHDDETLEMLIRPCKCKTMKIHRSCLNQWRAEKAANFASCEICLAKYQYEDIVRPFLQRARVRYSLVILLSILKHLAIMFGGISFFGLICYLADQNEKLPKLFGVSNHVGYFLWGFILFFITLDFYGICWMIQKTLKEERERERANHYSHQPQITHSTTFCFCPASDCGDCGSGGGGGGGGDGAVVCIAFCVIVLVVLGILFGLFFLCMDIGKEIEKHKRVLDNYALVDVQRVIDLGDV
jgi:hypothetical protein